LDRNIGRELVTIYVAKKRTVFVIYKKLLSHTADFFLKAFSGSFKESEGTMHLPEEHPGAFLLFIDWLYRSKISHVNTVRHWLTLFDLYIFAAKLCLNELANRTIDRIRHMESCTPAAAVTFALARHVYKNTFEDSPLRGYCVAALFFNFSSKLSKDKHVPADDRLKQMWKYSRDDFDLFVDYFPYLREHEGKVMKTPAEEGKDHNSEMSECKFHRHAKNEECYSGKSGLDFSTRSSETNIEDIENFSE
jgi:hypothetical protein